MAFKACVFNAEVQPMTTSTLTPATGVTARRSPRRRSRLWRVGALVVAMGLLLTACNEQEARMTELTRDARAAVGLPMFRDNGPLYQKAMAWAQQMAANGGISHSDLAAGNPYNWKLLGENVGMGCGVSIDAIHNALMNSPGHRANLLNSKYNHWAVAVFTDSRGCMWVVQEFMQL